MTPHVSNDGVASLLQLTDVAAYLPYNEHDSLHI